MDQELDTLETGLDDGQEAELDQDTTGADDAAGGNEDFLVVDGRTRYKTPEEAIKGFRNAGERISQLTPYERIAKQYKIDDPTKLIPLLNAGLKAQQEAEAANAKKGNSGEADVFSDPNLTPVQKNALKWLKENAAKVGYVPKSELDALVERLKKVEDGFSTATKQSEEKQLQALVREGRGHLRSLMTDAKLPVTDPKFTRFVEAAIIDYVEEDEERTGRFNAGGEELKGLIKEAFDEVSKALKLVAIKAGADAITQKKTAIQKTQQVLSRNGEPGARRDKGVQKPKGFTSDLHEKAWEKFRSMREGSEE